MRPISRAVAKLLVASVVVSGCATEPSGMFRSFSVDRGGSSVSLDARQRTILSRGHLISSRTGLIAPDYTVCAEPSPDVGTAIASSLGAGISVLNYGSASVSGQLAEGLVQLTERTMAIQMMRDQMYRACEAYANGAITGTSYTLLMSQITATMVTLMLGESAAGAFGRSLAALGGKSAATASASLAGLPGALSDIRQSTQQLADAELKVSKAEADLAAAKTKLEQDQGAQAEIDAAQGRLTRARAERDALRELLQTKIDTASSAAGEMSRVVAAGGIAAKPDAAVATVLGEMQRTFVQRDPSYALVEACLVEMGMWNTAPRATALWDNPATRFANGQPFSRDVAAGLAAASARIERTGLFDFCQANLPAFSLELARVNGALQLERAGLERRALDLRWIEARASTAAGVASALGQCERIADGGARERCKVIVLEVGRVEPAQSSERAERLHASLTRSVGGLALPTLSFDRAKQALDAAMVRGADLQALAFDVPANLTTDAKTRREAAKADMVGRRQGVSAKLKAGIETVGEKLGEAARKRLAELERSQTDLSSAVDNQADPLVRAIKQAELEKARLEARYEVETYDGLARQFTTYRAEIEALIAEWNQASTVEVVKN